MNAATEPREERTAKWFLDEAGRKALLTLEEEAGLAAKAQEGRRAVAALARMTGLPEEELLAYFRRRAADLPGGSEEDARFREAVSALGREGRRLASLATEGAEAWAALVERNLRLAAHFSGERTGEGLDLEDLLQEGNRGLMAAAERFDPSRGVRFSTYRKEGVWGSYNAPVFKPGIHGLPHLRRRRRGTEGIVVYHSWHEGPRVGPTRSNAAGEGDPSMKAEAYPFKGRRRSLK